MIRDFVSTLLDPFNERLDPLNDLRLWVSILRPRTSTVGGFADGGGDRNVHQGVGIGLSKEPIGRKHSARGRLDGFSDFRIRSSQVNFCPSDSTGSGGKADVVQAKFQRRWYSIAAQPVAVKKLRNIHTKKACNEFVHEVEMMAGLSHKNIVRLIGFVEDFEKGTAWIFLPWEPNGNVSEFLAKGDWEILERLSLIQDTFEGIKYLHTRQPPICHGDLKSLNILVSSSYRAVITDFGSARAIIAPEEEVIGSESGQQGPGIPTRGEACPPIHAGAAGNQLTLTGPAWSLRWAAPEVMNGKCPSLSSDIWAAGWVCWEIMTDTVPFSELSSAGVITLTVMQGAVPSPREDGQLGQIVALCSLMTDCWAFNPRARPSIARCCDELRWMPSVPPSSSKVPSVELLLEKGRMHCEQDNFENAGLLFQQALSLARSAGNQIGNALALSLLGNVYCVQFRFTEAEESYTQAQEIFACVGSDLGQAHTLKGLGDVYHAHSKYIVAEESFIRAHTIYARIGNDLGQANALRGLADVYGAQSKYTEAEQSFTQAREVYARIGDDLGRANALKGLGDVYCAQSRYTEAEQSFTRAQEFYARIGNGLGRANTLYGICLLCWLQGRNIEAAAHYAEAEDLYARIGRTGTSRVPPFG
ncbi:hypothetical protein M407DRAFT_28342 [Tulasnella calospora MUT 4182]|uniref:Protein kinase domain-containing protein n=1 Tax=Tulasnella calospora MUT 4182 TaxID=1051891 RepID=A0A0C3QC84_9AGAM|nr:hypothetical protein M407DRAFT_28342 [Tulasnella calospora MUT 4182]